MVASKATNKAKRSMSSKKSTGGTKRAKKRSKRPRSKVSPGPASPQNGEQPEIIIPLLDPGNSSPYMPHPYYNNTQTFMLLPLCADDPYVLMPVLEDDMVSEFTQFNDYLECFKEASHGEPTIVFGLMPRDEIANRSDAKEVFKTMMKFLGEFAHHAGKSKHEVKKPFTAVLEHRVYHTALLINAVRNTYIHTYTCVHTYIHTRIHAHIYKYAHAQFDKTTALTQVNKWNKDNNSYGSWDFPQPYVFPTDSFNVTNEDGEGTFTMDQVNHDWMASRCYFQGSEPALAKHMQGCVSLCGSFPHTDNSNGGGNDRTGKGRYVGLLNTFSKPGDVIWLVGHVWSPNYIASNAILLGRKVVVAATHPVIHIYCVCLLYEIVVGS